MDPRNIYVGISNARRVLRWVLTLLGILLVSFGLLILAIPWLLQYLVGGLFILIGMALLGVAWRRRFAPRRMPPEQNQEPDVVDDWR